MEQPTSSPRLLTRIQKEIRTSFSNMQPVWPFFIILTVAMIILYVLTLDSNLVMRQPVDLVIFTLFMVVHTGLHWLSPLAGISGKRSAIYLLAQMTLVMSLIALVQYEPLFYALFLGLIGELLGVVKPLRRSLVAIFCLTGIMFITHGLFFRWETTLSFIIAMGPLTFFIVIYVYLFTRQLEERGRAEKLLKELETAHLQLSQYANRIEELTLTNERQRMARELHDTLSQGLAGVILQLEAAEQHLDEGHKEKGLTIVKQASSRARSTLAEARQVIDDLRNATPASVDLRDFIQAEADHFTSLTGLPCEVRIDKNTTISDQLALQIEKIISEGLTNIVRHAHANHSWIHLASSADKILLEIGDDGLGFDVDAYQFESGHYGLVGIRERVRLAGGVLKVESHPGEGTLLTITFSNASSGEKKP